MLLAYWLVWVNNYFSWKLKVLRLSQVPDLGEVNDEHVDSEASFCSLSIWNISAGTEKMEKGLLVFGFLFPTQRGTC